MEWQRPESAVSSRGGMSADFCQLRAFTRRIADVYRDTCAPAIAVSPVSGPGKIFTKNVARRDGERRLGNRLLRTARAMEAR